jgi:hypothetical protein
VPVTGHTIIFVCGPILNAFPVHYGAACGCLGDNTGSTAGDLPSRSVRSRSCSSIHSRLFTSSQLLGLPNATMSSVIVLIAFTFSKRSCRHPTGCGHYRCVDSSITLLEFHIHSMAPVRYPAAGVGVGTHTAGDHASRSARSLSCNARCDREDRIHSQQTVMQHIPQAVGIAGVFLSPIT